MKKVLVIEDEYLIRAQLVGLVKKMYPDFQIVGEADSVLKSVNYLLNETHPDLIFMDVELSDGLCFEIFNRVNITCPIIFTTAYQGNAMKDIKTRGIDYLLKPINEEDLVRVIKKFLDISQNGYHRA